MSDFQFTSVPFAPAASIPAEYTCDGEDVSPPLSWRPPPKATESLALVVDDPDAPGTGAFTHWILFNLPPSVTSLPRAYGAGDPRVDTESLTPREGMNDFGDVGYGGPCPPIGETHRYVFTLYALPSPLDLSAGADRAKVMTVLDGHVSTKAEHVGTYQRG
ncbi:hypothetical protein BSZ35_12935 [Salinibacter sp. 10B]|uniref:YbhB/YbcL family Raf kinase inhibitor-like protein n=1 Tax=Salinibacter sp. 10B TaxID=1923971 RepID=UPI000CF4E00A|nr:YbhB/YbcL family Raf kinase inhibitor-like protein [Salinibacter sp. 10B]PQJ35384.1 hypothetical protein BSZ35_12935 [Salinibacter sp. 10B]